MGCTNHGREAQNAEDITHSSGVQSSGDQYFKWKKEHAQYKGKHHMECIVIKKGNEVCRAKHIVNIK